MAQIPSVKVVPVVVDGMAVLLIMERKASQPTLIMVKLIMVVAVAVTYGLLLQHLTLHQVIMFLQLIT